MSTDSSSGISVQNAGYRLIKPCFIVVTGPSGVGKNTIIQELRRLIPEQLQFSISCTTRRPREGEVDGVNYHFITEARFQGLVSEGAFLEHAVVHGNYYGTRKEDVLASLLNRQSLIADIDVQGAKTLWGTKDEFLQQCLVGLFIVPTSIGDLRYRLIKRSTEDAVQVSKRIEAASEELKHSRMFPIPPIVNRNDDLAGTMFEIMYRLGEAGVVDDG